MKTLTQRFESRYIPVTETGCWLWTGDLLDSGYGTIWGHGKNLRAHRLSWEIYRGTVPYGAHVLHRCDVPCCVNPLHLYLGTQADNIEDARIKGRLKGVQGEKNVWAKLTEEEVLEIRALYMQGDWSHRRLARRFGVSHTVIGAIIRRENWSCVS